MRKVLLSGCPVVTIRCGPLGPAIYNVLRARKPWGFEVFCKWECARAHADSMERMFLFATDASPLTKLLGLTQKTGVTFHHVEDKP